MIKEILLEYNNYIILALVLLGSALLAFGTNQLFYSFYNKFIKRQGNTYLNTFFRYLHIPLYFILFLTFLTIFSNFLYIAYASTVLELTVKIMFVLVLAWSLIKVIDYADRWIEYKYRLKAKSPRDQESITTKIKILRKILIGTVIILTTSLILLNFESVRQVGKALLFSAGVAGLIAGIAIQRPLASVFTGFQIAFTQPLKIGDNIHVENEFGTIEEITLTHVTIRLWDLRRLVLPINYLLEKPYQNWSHPTSDLLGTIFIYVDYNANLEAIRTELGKILQSTPLWDKKFYNLQLTELKEHTMELRILLSAKDAGDLWNLRCYVREKIIQYIREQFPHILPKIQTQISIQDTKSLLNKTMNDDRQSFQ